MPLKLCFCLCNCERMCWWVPCQRPRASKIPEAGITGGCKLLSMDAGNKSWVFSKSSTWSSALCRVFSPCFPILYVTSKAWRMKQETEWRWSCARDLQRLSKPGFCRTWNCEEWNWRCTVCSVSKMFTCHTRPQIQSPEPTWGYTCQPRAKQKELAGYLVYTD